jgi:ethanolamine utilization protein EutJ
VEQTLSPNGVRTLEASVAALTRTRPVPAGAFVRCGVDLGTASVVVVALDEAGVPVAGELQPCQVARDGLVVDYMGAVDIVRRLVGRLRDRLGVPVEAAAIAVPPGTSASDASTHRHVVEAADLDVRAVLDEPTAANAVLGIRDGAVVDIGGGTTGVSVFEDSRVVYAADEATGGVHMSLVLMGRLGLTYEQAERVKRDPARADEVRRAVRPVAEKMAAIVARHVGGHDLDQVWLVGGAAGLLGIEDIFADRLGVVTRKPPHPMMVTPLGIALSVPCDDEEARP